MKKQSFANKVTNQTLKGEINRYSNQQKTTKALQKILKGK